MTNYPGDCRTPTADLLTVKLLLNSVISTEGARFKILGSGGAAVSRIIDHVAADGDSALIRVLLFWSVVADDTGIYDVFKPV